MANRTALVMTGGTGGHIFPALAVADALKAQGWTVVFLGAEGGMETRLVPQHGVAIDTIAVKGLRGKGVATLLSAPLRVLRAVRDAALGRRYLGSSVAQKLALSRVDGGSSPFDLLSPRELEVAMLLVQGLRQEDIAQRLNLSAKTINTHKTRAYDKLGIKDVVALARMVSQHGLGDPSQTLPRDF